MKGIDDMIRLPGEGERESRTFRVDIHNTQYIGKLKLLYQKWPYLVMEMFYDQLPQDRLSVYSI